MDAGKSGAESPRDPELGKRSRKYKRRIFDITPVLEQPGSEAVVGAEKEK